MSQIDSKLAAVRIEHCTVMKPQGEESLTMKA